MTLTETSDSPTRVTRFVHSVVLSWGWRRAAIAWSAGALSVLAMAPFDAWPVLFLTFPIMVWLIDGAAEARQAYSGVTDDTPVWDPSGAAAGVPFWARRLFGEMCVHRADAAAALGLPYEMPPALAVAALGDRDRRAAHRQRCHCGSGDDDALHLVLHRAPLER